MFHFDDTARLALHRDLEAIADRDTKCHHYATNHASMTLTALHSLRTLLSNDELRAAADKCIEHYRTVTVNELRGEPTPSFGADVDGSLTVDSEEQVWLFLGRRDAVSAVGRFLKADLLEALARLGADAPDARRTIYGAWLGKWLGHPHVRHGVGCAAVHGILRIAFGLDCDYAPDVALGVATVITNYHTTPKPSDAAEFVVDPQGSVDAAMLVQTLRHLEFMNANKSTKVGGLDGRCAAFFAHPDFAPVLPRLDGGQPRLVMRNILQLAVSTFTNFHDFSALHVFTGSVAMLTLVEVMEGHVASLAMGDLLSGFWAEALAIVLQLPHNAKARAEAAVNPSSEPPTHERREMPQAVTTTADREAHDAGEVSRAAASAMRAAVRDQFKLPSTEFEHLVKLAYAAVVAVRRARGMEAVASEIFHAAWCDSFEHDAAAVVARETIQTSPF